MKFYDSVGPNPAAVRIFAAEKGVTLDRVPVDIMGGANRQPDYLAKNPAGTTPALELDDGTVLGDVVAICEYLEDTHPSPPLIGSTPAERAETRMWVRRIDLGILEPVLLGFRATGGRRMFESRMKLVSKEAGGELIDLARERTVWLDGQLAGRTWVCGDRYSLADVMLYAFTAFTATVRQPLAETGGFLPGWFARAAARPSAGA